MEKSIIRMSHRRLALAFAFALCAAGATRADIRIRERRTFGSPGREGARAQTFESDVAIKGQRQRNEQQLPGMERFPGMSLSSALRREAQAVLSKVRK